MKKYFSYDDEYISGNTYFLRFMLNFILVTLLIGFYLLSVNAYKRSKSLGHSENVSIIWAIWGFLVPILGLLPIFIFTNTIPHLYLWFSNGEKNKKPELKEVKTKINIVPDSTSQKNEIIKESLIPKSLSSNNEDVKENSIDDLIKNFENTLKQISDSNDQLYDYSYWYSFVKQRANIDNLDKIYSENSNSEEYIETSAWGHFDEYSKRMLSENLDQKNIFIKPRIICYGKILDLLVDLRGKLNNDFKDKNINNQIEAELIHAKASLFGAIKFAQKNNIGDELIKSWYPNFSDDVKSVDSPYVNKIRKMFVGVDSKSKLYQIYELSLEENKELPFWFRKGLFIFGYFKKGKTFEINNSKVKLNRLERSMYFHYLQFTMLLEKLPELTSDGKNYLWGKYEFYIQTYEIKELIIHWFEENNKNAFEIIFDDKKK